MKWDQPRDVESVYYDLKLADFPRSLNRSLIDKCFNGLPPYSPEEELANNITVNVNDLTSTRIAHDARAQFSGAFLRPGNFFRCHTDMGPVHKREKWNATVTKEINKPMKRSLDYFEKFRSTFALDVLHGIGPGGWDDRDHWCPEAYGITDVLVPSNTLLTMKNLPFFFKYRSYTAPELIKLTKGPKVDKGWNLPLVEKLLQWIDEESRSLLGNTWPEVWSPEKMGERIKSDGAMYSSDKVPTIDCCDFYYYSDEGRTSGWRRRMILDSWSTPSMVGGRPSMDRNNKLDFAAGEFLFNPGSRKYADRREEIIHFQFADLSAVAPFRYHSVRSLGFLLWAQCHLMNRLRCKFNEAVFESLMMYFRVKSMDDVQRALKVELINRGFIDESVQFVPPEQRWQVNANLAELGLNQTQQLITQHSSSYVQNQEHSSDRVEKTKFQVMAEVNAMTTLISAALQQAYQYQNFEYREIFRRFCKRNSADPDVRTFRANCLKQGVPEEVLVPEAWEQEAERVMGAGNKSLEMAITEQLMQWRPLFDPEPQREILRQAVFNITDDPARAEALVPEQPHISDSVHDTELVFGSLMQGSPVTPKPGLNAVEVCATMLRLMGEKIQQITQSGGVGTPQDLVGLQLAAKYTSDFMGMLAQDPESKAIVKKIGDALGKLMNLVKAFAQRQQEAAQQQNGQAQMSPEDQQKLQYEAAKSQLKLQTQKQSHAQRLAQRSLQFESEQARADREHAQNIQHGVREHQAEILKTDLAGAAEINRSRLKSLNG